MAATRSPIASQLLAEPAAAFPSPLPSQTLTQCLDHGLGDAFACCVRQLTGEPIGLGMLDTQRHVYLSILQGRLYICRTNWQ